MGCRAAGDCAASPGVPCLDLERPSFSGDGTTIAFADDPCRYAYCGRLTLIDSDGGGETQLPALTADDSQPAFTASGELIFTGRVTARAQPPCANGSIAFVHHRDVYLLSADHRSRRRLSFHGGGWPACAPSSRQIAFVHAGSLYLVGVKGRGLRRLTREPGGVFEAPSFAPAGGLIAFPSRHPASRGWRPAPAQGTGPAYNAYVQVVDLRGREHRKPLFLGTSGNDSDGFGFSTVPGGVSWGR